MSSRQFRIIVRGAFGELSDEQRAQLLAEAGEHDVLFAAFTPEGHLTYDVAARPFFTFRFADAGNTDEDLPRAEGRALERAEAWLTGRGLPFGELTALGEDLSKAPLGKRQRRAAARGN